MSELSPDRSSSLLDKIREEELAEARLIHLAMMPTESLRAPTFEVACKFRPAADVGGDFLDYFWLDSQRVGLYVGDVVGKGLPAALFAALAAGALRGFRKTGVPANSLLEQLNKRLRMRTVPRRFCVIQYAVFDVQSGEIQYSNAGLPPPFHISATGCQQLEGSGLPSGLFESVSYDNYTAQLAPGDALLFTTDGVTEAQNAKDEEFGVERLTEVCARNRNESADDMLDRIFEAVGAFTAGCHQTDDMTSALLKLTGP